MVADQNLEGTIHMTKNTKILIGIITVLFVVSGLVWWFKPVHFLRGVEPEEVAVITVFKGNNSDEFEITDPDDISHIVNAIKQISLKKDQYISGADYYYNLTFVNENGEEIDHFGIQNHIYMRRDDFFYRCNEDPSMIAEYLKGLEAIQFPDYNKDPDFLP